MNLKQEENLPAGTQLGTDRRGIKKSGSSGADILTVNHCSAWLLTYYYTSSQTLDDHLTLI
jgi:hypothetical protein